MSRTRTVSMRRQRGFTLIELMVTSVIIFLLAAVAIPAYRNYVATGRQEAIQLKVNAFRMFEEAYRVDNGTYVAGTYVPGGTNNFATNLGYAVRNDSDGITLTVQAGACGTIAKCYKVTGTNTRQGVSGTWENGNWTWTPP